MASRIQGLWIPGSRKSAPRNDGGWYLSDSPVQPRQQKYSCSLLTQITGLFLAVPALSEGRIAIVTDVGRRCGGRGCAFDEQR